MITCGGIHVVPRRVPDGEIICVCMLHAQCIAARVVVARTCCTKCCTLSRFNICEVGLRPACDNEWRRLTITLGPY